MSSFGSVMQPIKVAAATAAPFSFNFAMPTATHSEVASKKQDDELAAAFTCSICLDLFKVPKNMPNCGHVFCQNCLQLLLQRELNKQRITCPDCRTQSTLGTGGISDLKTNIPLQRGAETLKKHSETVLTNIMTNVARSSTTDRCPHQMYLTNSNSFKCDHCESKFCDRCVVVHAEVMKTEILQRGNKLEQRVGAVVDGADARIDRLKVAIQRDLQEIEFKVVEACQTLEKAVSEAVTTERDKLLAQARSFGDRQLQKVEQIVTSVRSKQALDTQLCSEVAQLVSKSVLSCSVGDVAKLHKKVTDRDAEVKALEKLKETPEANSSLMCKVAFKPDDKVLKTVIGQFKAFSIGSIEETGKSA